MKVLTLLDQEQQEKLRSAATQERLPWQQKMNIQRCSPLYSAADKEFNLRTLKDLYKSKRCRW
jgi:hypothetical protein